MEDLYTWRVVYLDGTIINEYDEAHPQGRGFAEVYRSHVARVELVSSDEFPSHAVSIPAQHLPVFFRRRSVEVNAVNGSEKRRTAHCIGYDGVYLFVLQNGATVLTNDRQEVQP